MADDDLRLNTLHRFSKRSPKLVLEEHSHCEVPAGCGGVVLRWIDPSAGRTAIVRLAAVGTVTAFLDGVRLETSHVVLPFGERVLAIHAKGEGGPFLAVVASDAPNDERIFVASSSAFRVAPADPASGPPESWIRPDHDDRAWAMLPGGSLDDVGENRWHWDRLVRLGAEPLQLPRGEAWIRVRFRVPRT